VLGSEVQGLAAGIEETALGGQGCKEGMLWVVGVVHEAWVCKVVVVVHHVRFQWQRRVIAIKKIENFSIYGK